MINQTNDHLFQEVAVIGMAGSFPMSSNIEKFWENLKNGKEMVSFFSDEELRREGIGESSLSSSRYVKAKGIIEDAEWFDAELFGYSPREAETMDPQQRRLLECAWTALENAGYDPEQYEGTIGVFVGSNPSTYFLTKFHSDSNQQSTSELEELSFLLGNGSDYLSTRISYKLNLKGPSKTIQTACSTSLVCIHDACQNLINYQCDLALAGGVAISFPLKSGYFYSPESINSPDGHCRAFAHDSTGTVFGDGLGLVVLKRLEDAINDRDTILAVVKGSSVNNDGSDKVGFLAPSVKGQAEVIAAALAAADVTADSISYVETHGTGTALGDPIEIAALTEAFRMETEDTQFCAIGSLKTNIGHLVTAAGVASFIKTVLMLQHRALVPSLHFEKANPKIPFSTTPFFVNSKLRPWISKEGPLRGGVSSFGIGGTNAHIILEEAPACSQDRLDSYQDHLLLFSANSEETLKEILKNFIDYLGQGSPNLRDVAYTLQVGRKALPYQYSFVCRSIEEAILKLKAALVEPQFLRQEYPPKNATKERDALLSKRIPLPTYPFARKKFSRDVSQEALSSTALSKPEKSHLDLVERMVALFWEDVLKIDSSSLSRGDNFFLLGGDSMNAIEVLEHIKAMLSIEIGLQDFLSNPTIAHLAELIRERLLVRG